MASVNHVFILGNVGNDPKVSDIGDNRRAAQFSVATNERRKDSAGQPVDVTEWHNIVALGSLADIASKYIRKGAQVAVEGRLRPRDFPKAGMRSFRRAGEAFGRQRGSIPRRGAKPRKRGQGSPGVTFQPK